jgi:thiamine biosynthesis lipoprotein
MSNRGLFNYAFTAMGSNCEVRLYEEEHQNVEDIACAAAQEVERIGRKFSRYRSDSIVADINAAAKAGASITVDSETAHLLNTAFDAHRVSGGLFDISSGVLREIWNDNTTVLPSQHQISEVLERTGLDKIAWTDSKLLFSVPGMQIDLGGLGKEYAADRVAEICWSQGIKSGLIDLGGDLVILGPHPDGTPWRIGVRDPASPDEALVTLFVAGGGVATSGDYERFWIIDGKRYSHILNPMTGWPINGLSSVTVVAENGLKAGMMSTIAMLKGADGPTWMQHDDVVNFHIEASGQTGGWGIQDGYDQPVPNLKFTQSQVGPSVASSP